MNEQMKLKPKGGSLFQELLVFIKERLRLSEDDAVMIALWIMATYVVRVFETFPILVPVGGFGSGKTTVLRVVEAVSCRPFLLGEYFSPASVYWNLTRWKTAILDEFSALEGRQKNVASTLLRGRWHWAAKTTHARRVFKYHGPTTVALDDLNQKTALISRLLLIRMEDSK